MPYRKTFSSRVEAMQAKRDIGFPWIYVQDPDGIPVFFHKSLTEDDVYYSGMVEFTPNDGVDIINVVDEMPMDCKIYRYMSHSEYDRTAAPVSHNYITGLNTRLHAKRTFVKGELQSVEWHSNKSFTDMVIRVDIEYTRDSVGFASERTTTRTWIREDESDCPGAKVTVKDYSSDTIHQVEESKRRRKNIVDGMYVPALGFLIYTLTPLEGETAEEKQTRGIGLAQVFMKTLKEDFMAYIDEANQAILTSIQNATDSWLDNEVPGQGPLTIRGYIIAQLTLP